MPVSPETVDPGKFLQFVLLEPAAAVEFLKQKGWEITFDWRDMEPAAHKTKFTAAKIMQMDVLEEIRKAVEAGLRKGIPFQEIIAGLKDVLAEKGWWGEKTVVDPQTGVATTIKVDARRLKRIYDTNLSVAYSEGQWERIQDSKKTFPYLFYDGCNSSESRVDHCAWDGLVLPVDSPWWQNHYPVKQWGCKCRVYSLTAGQVQRRGLSVSQPPEEKYTNWENERTGKTMRLPQGVDPAFNYPPGGWGEAMNRLAGERWAALPTELQQAVGNVGQD